MDIREQLARDLLSAPYSELSQQKKSVIDLIADQKPTGLGPLEGGEATIEGRAGEGHEDSPLVPATAGAVEVGGISRAAA